MNFSFNRTRKPEPVEAITVHLWHRQPDQAKVMQLRDEMLATKGMRHATLVIHDDTEQQPGCVVIEGLDCGDFDLKLFRQMVSDILN
jgi:hypothetical protein